jgi:ribosomal protein L28
LLPVNKITHEWWDNEKTKYNIYVSRIVLKEINEGDPHVASIRANFLQGIKVLPATDEIDNIAEKYLSILSIPKKSALDALI